jgi:hypothetical protein
LSTSDDPTCSPTTEEELRTLADSGLRRCDLIIRETQLRNLDAARGLRRVSSVVLDTNPALMNVDGLDGLADDFPLVMVRSRLPGMLTVPDAAIGIDLVHAETETLVSNREAELSLEVADDSQLRQLRFPNVVRLTDLSLQRLPILTQLSESFPSLQEVGGLVIKDCPNIHLAEIEALAELVPTGIDSVEHCGNADDDPCG